MREPQLSPATARRLADEIRRGRRRIILIDGPSGAGKSTFATQLAEQLGREATLVRMDALYPGWDGLAQGCQLSSRFLIEPVARGRVGRYRRWNWATDASGQWVSVGRPEVLILEGCGAATARNGRLADFVIWIEADDDIRRTRAIARDGAVFAAEWDRWEAQFQHFVTVERPRRFADRIFTT